MSLFSSLKEYLLHKDVNRVLDNIDKITPTVEESIKGVAEITTDVATVAKSDNDVAIEMHKQLVDGTGSWFTNNVRPLGFLVSFGLLVGQLFGYVPDSAWPLTICLSYMGARTVDKLGQVISAASAVKVIMHKSS